MTFQTGIANYGVRDASGNLDEATLAAVAANEQVRMFEINSVEALNWLRVASCPEPR